MSSGQQSKLHNRLWQARKRARLAQKQVALLLDHHTADQVSRYEKGLRVPTLETALRLEIIYGTPIRHLFGDLHHSLLADLSGKTQSSPGLQNHYAELIKEGQFGYFCSHAEKLLSPDLSPEEETLVRAHVIRLARHLAELAPKNAEV